MANLDNFTVNSNFPILSKTGQCFLSFGFVGRTIQPFDYAFNDLDYTFSNLDEGWILSTSIEYQNKRYPLSNFSIYENNIAKHFYFEVIGNNTIKATILVENFNTTATYVGGFNAKFFVNCFRVN